MKKFDVYSAQIGVRLPSNLLAKSFKVGLSPSKKICFICLNESPFKMMKNVFYFILKRSFGFQDI